MFSERDTMKPIGLFVKAEYLTKLSKKQVITLYQVFRIINNLEFQIRSYQAMANEQDELFRLRNQIELHFGIMSSYKEAIKEFDNKLAKELLGMDLSEELSSEISEYCEWLSTRETDPYLQAVDRARNCLRYHFKSKIYDECIKEGSQSEDLMIGYAIGDTYRDFMYTEPYSMELQYICGTVPSTVEKGQASIDWIRDRSETETKKFLGILRKVAYGLLKENVYKKNI